MSLLVAFANQVDRLGNQRIRTPKQPSTAVRPGHRCHMPVCTVDGVMRMLGNSRATLGHVVVLADAFDACQLWTPAQRDEMLTHCLRVELVAELIGELDELAYEALSVGDDQLP